MPSEARPRLVSGSVFKNRPNPSRIKPLAERFWSKVRRVNGDGCWLWTGYCDSDGYGKFDRARAHRVALSLTLGRPIAPGMLVCHSCDTPPCCNPAHLREDTAAGNLREARDKGRHFVGEKNPTARLTKEQAQEIIDASPAGRLPRGGITAYACKFGVSLGAIKNIAYGNNWAHLRRLGGGQLSRGFTMPVAP